jgi:predicted RNA-binding protein with PIN domain
MPMHILVDGYNVLGTRGQVGPDSERAREQLVHELMNYHQRKGHAVTVVFDGWRQGLASERREHRAGVEVIYSKRGEQADQVIQRLAEEFGALCAVVTSDQEIQRRAKAHEALIISASEFETRLRERPAVSRSAGYLGKDAQDEERPKRNPDKKGNARKLPKALRRKNRQLKGF